MAAAPSRPFNPRPPWHKQVPGAVWTIFVGWFLSFVGGGFAMWSQGIELKERLGTVQTDVSQMKSSLSSHIDAFRAHEDKGAHDEMLTIHQKDFDRIQTEFRHQRELLLRIESRIKNGN